QVSHRLPSGVWRRGAMYQYRVRVPADLRQVIGSSHINRSLRTASLAVARRSAKVMAYQIDRSFEEARNSGAWKAASAQPQLHVAEVAASSTTADHGLTLGVVVERYLTDATISRSPKSQIVYRTTFATVCSILGSETPIKLISRDGCRQVLRVLQALPPNSRKRWPGISPVDVAADAHQRGVAPMSAANCNEYMNKLSSLLNWAVREEMIDRNPARGLRVADRRLAREKRDPFTLPQLSAIFTAPLYTGCKDDGLGYAVVGPNRPRRGRFWIPLIALWSGMRQAEICQLLTADVRSIENVLCFVVSDVDGGSKRLKTAASRRLVPVHPELMRIGFAHYVSERRRSGDCRLFPDLSLDSLGLYSGKFAKWFARFLASTNAAAPGACFHGFRHSFRDALRDARIDRDIALTLGGWTTSSGSSGGGVADAYGRGYRSSALNDAISKIAYPGLDLSHLYVETSKG
ncbi:site-specific integrase, partial [Sphingomonas sp. TX0522]|uniref:site-specific integrase n=1 Tax=Sphingomonas sp. TX0522 TaxID=2479205 RepID=UPI001E4F1B96